MREGDTDFELIWGSVFLGMGLLFALWYGTWKKMDLPLPQCGFHSLTGIPCMTCGFTRGVFSLLRGNWLRAFAWNPLCFLVEFAVALYAFYAVATVAFRLPRIRIAEISQKDGFVSRCVIAAALAANWIYVIVSQSRHG